MGMDIRVYKLEGTKTSVVHEDRGWSLGEFLIHAFDLDNCKPEFIELKSAYKKIKKESKDLVYQGDDESYESAVIDLLNFVGSVVKDQKADYQLELYW